MCTVWLLTSVSGRFVEENRKGEREITLPNCQDADLSFCYSTGVSLDGAVSRKGRSFRACRRVVRCRNNAIQRFAVLYNFERAKLKSKGLRRHHAASETNATELETTETTIVNLNKR